MFGILSLIIAVGVAAAILHGFWYQRSIERRFPPTGEIVDIAGRRVHFRVVNPDAAGTPVLMIHGASCNLNDMALAAESAGLSQPVILVDRPGFGYSQRCSGDETLAQQASVIDQLLEHLGISRVIVVAQSFGTAVALSLALNHPQRAAGLVLLAPVSHRWPGGVAWYNHAAITPLLGHFLRYAIIPLFARFAGSTVMDAAFWPASPPAGYRNKAALAMAFRPESFRSNAEDLVALFDQVAEMEQRYSSIRLPIRMIAGTHDTIVLSTIHAMSLEAKVPGARLRYVPGAGHPIHHFAPELISAEIRAIEIPPAAAGMKSLA